MRLILVRHGETRLNKAGRVQGINDEPLNATGKAQARAVATVLADDVPFYLYASPLARALETAQTTSDAVHVPITTLNELREADVGDLDGMTIPEIRERYPGFMERWATDSATVRMPGGESLLQVQKRAWPAIEKLAEKHADDVVVVVTHNFVIQTLIGKLLEMPLHKARSLRQEPGSITRLELSESRQSLISLNETWYLRDIEPAKDESS